MEIKGEWMGVNWLSPNVQIHQHYKEKNNKNRQKMKSREGQTTKLAQHRAHGRAAQDARLFVPPPRAVVVPTVSLWWPLSRPVSPLLEHCVFCLLVLRFGPQVLPILGYFGPPLRVSLIHVASQHLSITCA